MQQYVFAAEPCTHIPFATFQVLEDTSRNMTLQQVMAAKKFEPRELLAFGYTQSAYWIKAAMPDVCEGNNNFIVSDYPGVDYIDFYVVRNGKVLKELSTGYLRPLATREKPINRAVMQLPADVTMGDEIYVRLQKKEGTLRTSLSIQEESALGETNFAAKQQLFFFLGVSFLMILFALAYLVYFKASLFGWYIMFVVSFSLHQLINHGYGPLFLWGDWFWMSNIGRVAFNAPAVLATLLFSYQILRVKEFSPPWISTAYKCLIAYKLFEMPLPFLPLPEYPWRFILYAVHCIGIVATLFVLIYAAVQAIRRKHIPGYLFMAGEVVLFGTVLLLVLRNFNILSSDSLPEFIDLYVGITTMSLALFSMVAHTRQMHTQIITQFIEQPKPEPKQLTEEEVQKAGEVFEKIEGLFKINKPYLDPDVSVKSVVDLTNLPEHLISRAINLKADMHFFDYVNQYRVEEAKTLLTDEKAVKQFTIEALAMQCGFSNKTSFNKAFKKFTGETPSAYRDRLAQMRNIS